MSRETYEEMRGLAARLLAGYGTLPPPPRSSIAVYWEAPGIVVFRTVHSTIEIGLHDHGYVPVLWEMPDGSGHLNPRLAGRAMSLMIKGMPLDELARI